MLNPHNAVIAVPPSRRLHRAWRALKSSRQSCVALIVPDSTASLSDLSGVDQVIAWASELNKDVTIVGGSPQVRAEAVTRGLRASTDLAAWHDWLAAEHERTAHRAAHASDTWRVIPPTQPRPATDTQPEFVMQLGAQVALIPLNGYDGAPDEYYEDRVIALLWETSAIDQPGNQPPRAAGQ